MKIQHEIQINNRENLIYLYISLEDEFEFSNENFNGKIEKVSLKKEIKEYIQKNIKYIKGGIIVVIVNGIIIGSLVMKPESNTKDISESIYLEYDQETILADNKKDELDNFELKEKEENNIKTEQDENIKKDEELKSNMAEDKTNNLTISNKNTTTITNTKKNQTTANNNSEKEDIYKPIINEKKPQTTNTTISSDSKVEENTSKNTYIKLNTNGVIKEIELETYIIGVVAAEMPASFNIEALKAQAVAARTYAMKKASRGIVLKNSTSDQVYKTTEQLKVQWGSSYTTYYNKVKTAVNATKGLVLKYNGEYIDAQYCSMTNGKTELPEYVWSYSRPYLKCVSSSWDTKVKNFEVTKKFSYSEVSSKLGETITKDTIINVISRTVSDRVEKIQIGNKTFSGTKLRSLLGLRSTDFTIKLNETNIEITTKGFGHGVGMSQYGAHMAANEGYSYAKILNHYYVGAKIVSI